MASKVEPPSNAKAAPEVAAAAPAEQNPSGVRMWSPKGNLPDGSTHIGLTTGHTMVVPHDRAGVTVPKHFRREAIARGCIPVGMEEDEPDEKTRPDRNDIIRDCIKKMQDSDEAGMFTTDGHPALPALSKMCGFQLSRSEVNRVWDEMHRIHSSETISNIGASDA